MGQELSEGKMNSSKNALWVILVVGLLSLISFGSMGLWNQSHPVFQIRNSVTEKFGIEVTRMELLKNEEGRNYGVNFILKNEEGIEKTRGEEMALELFTEFMKLKPDNQLEVVRLTTLEKQVYECQRISAVAVASATRRIDKMKLALMSVGLGQADVKIPSAGDYGANVRISVTVDDKKFKDPRLSQSIADIIQKTKGVTIGSVEVILKSKAKKERKVVFPPKGRKIGRIPSYR